MKAHLVISTTFATLVALGASASAQVRQPQQLCFATPELVDVDITAVAVDGSTSSRWSGRAQGQICMNVATDQPHDVWISAFTLEDGAWIGGAVITDVQAPAQIELPVWTIEEFAAAALELFDDCDGTAFYCGNNDDDCAAERDAFIAASMKFKEAADELTRTRDERDAAEKAREDMEKRWDEFKKVWNAVMRAEQDALKKIADNAEFWSNLLAIAETATSFGFSDALGGGILGKLKEVYEGFRTAIKTKGPAKAMRELFDVLLQMRTMLRRAAARARAAFAQAQRAYTKTHADLDAAHKAYMDCLNRKAH